MVTMPQPGEPSGEPVPVGARLTREDVTRRLAARAAPLVRANPEPAPVPRPDASAAGADEVQPFNPIRRRTAEHLARSVVTAAHTLVVMEADYAPVARVRKAAQPEFEHREGFGLTFLPFVARAVVDAIAAFPRVNASVEGDALVVHRDVHLGVAVDLDFEGLVVPVVRDAGRWRLRALAAALHERAVTARARNLRPDDVSGGTFTITNAGGYGTLVTAPIIPQPQVAILSVDSVAMRPMAWPTDEGGYGVAVRPVGNLSLSFDHRAFDGAYASAFLRRAVEILGTRDWEAELR